MSKEISQRTPQEITRLLQATSGTRLPQLIRHQIGTNVCDAATAQEIAVILNRKWVLEIRPNLPDTGPMANDDAKIRHADNILGALKELGVSIRASGNTKDLHSRATKLYEARSADTNCRKDLPHAHRIAAVLPSGGFGISH